MIFNTKTIARLAVVQLLYLYDFDSSKELKVIADDMISLYQEGLLVCDEDEDVKITINTKYFYKLVSCLIENLQEVDKILISHYKAEQGSRETLQGLVLALLRAGLCEFKYFPSVPPKVLIDEYTTIASSILSLTQTGFVNLFLDNLTKNISRIDVNNC